MNVPCAFCGKDIILAGFNEALFYALKTANMIPAPSCGTTECRETHADKYNAPSIVMPVGKR